MSKSNFLLSDEWEPLFASLPDAEAGKLIKAAFAYHTGKDATIDDPMISAIFQMIKAKIDANDRKYAEICQKRAEAARAKEEQKQASASKCKQMQANASNRQQVTPDNEYDNDSDNEYVYVNDSDIQKRKRHKYGEYKHVLLTDQQYKKLLEEYGNSITDRSIKIVDEYCQRTGKHYKDYNLVLRGWGLKEAKKQEQEANKRGSYDIDALERMLVNQI